MKPTLFTLALIAGIFAWTHRCEAGYCSPAPCFGKSACGSSCLCMRTDSGPGVCVSLEAVPGLLADGWKELE